MSVVGIDGDDVGGVVSYVVETMEGGIGLTARYVWLYSVSDSGL